MQGAKKRPASGQKPRSGARSNAKAYDKRLAGRGYAPSKAPQNAGKGSGGNGAGRVIQYQKPVNLNFGIIIMAVILIYTAYSLIRYVTAKHVVAYEVRTGSLASDRIYQGLALRSETVVGSEYSGYINYYSPETDRLSTGALAYTVDESGQVQSYLAQNATENNILSDSDYQTLAAAISSFEDSFSASDFGQVYTFKSSLTASIQKMTNRSILKDLSSASASSLHYCNTTDTGDIVYSVDGYEGKTFQDLVTSDFDTSNYKKTELTNGDLVVEGDPAYKLETSEDWSIAIQVSSQEEADYFTEEGVVEVRFLKNQYESWATVGEVRKLDEDHLLVELTFTNSMITFCTDRFLTIEVLNDSQTGLKVPKTALIDDTFFAVPRDYITEGMGTSGSGSGVLRQIVDSDGEKSTEFISVTPYTKEDDTDHYYLSQDSFSDGDVLVKPDSSETLTLSSSMTDTLTGVYNINKGYADFCQVTKIAENDDYAIVEANSTYGLREYDYIVLNADATSPDEFLYE